MSGDPWDAETTLGHDDVRRLLSSQFPALPLRNLHLLAEAVAGIERAMQA